MLWSPWIVTVKGVWTHRYKSFTPSLWSTAWTKALRADRHADSSSSTQLALQSQIEIHPQVTGKSLKILRGMSTIRTGWKQTSSWNVPNDMRATSRRGGVPRSRCLVLISGRSAGVWTTELNFMDHYILISTHPHQSQGWNHWLAWKTIILMDVRMMSLCVNSCGMILNAYIHLPKCLQLAWMFKGRRVFLIFDFYVLIMPVSFYKLCEIAHHVGVLFVFRYFFYPWGHFFFLFSPKLWIALLKRHVVHQDCTTCRLWWDVLYLTDNGTWKWHAIMNFRFPSHPLSIWSYFTLFSLFKF